MRVLTVKQPWAWAIIHGGKDVENRVRNLAGDYRGPVAIHAGLGWAEGSFELDAVLAAAREKHLRSSKGDQRLPWYEFGLILGTVDLVDVVHDSESQWAQPDAVHLVLANPRPLTVPMEWKGALGLRRLPAETAAMVRELQR
jgi:hypothetical protein